MLPKNYEAEKTEREIQEFWEKEQIYRYAPDNRPVFSIDTPPPTVSGSLHIGHIFSYTQAEIVARFMRMQGRNVFYPFGFDDNGLPTERLVEKELGVRAAELPRGEFTALCRQIAARTVGEFRSLWKAMGFSVDWDLQYETVGPLAQKLSQASFIRLAKAGHAYQKQEPVLWCPGCRTSIAQAELDSAERESSFNTLPFTVGGRTVPVATTRPELLYGCVALFVHPQDARYADLPGKTARVPLYGFEIPVLADEGVEREKGTGAVMCATFGDAADLVWYKKYALPYKRTVEPDGRISPDVPELGGMKIKAAREKIIGLLGENGLLLKSEKIRHTVAVHERCGGEVEILPSRQWYIDVLSQKEKLLAAGDAIDWHPASMKTRYRLWVENLKWDWCISRQRYFGVPFPVWTCKSCGRPVFASPAQLPVNPLETQPEEPCACGCREFAPETAVLDTWATSSLSPLINARAGEPDERKILPMSLRTQAHEIIRTWAFYTIVRSLYESGEIPWKEIMVCGFVLAKKGEKISKSKGNAADSPEGLIRRYSADGLRYWAAGAHLGTDTLFSTQELRLSARLLTKLWNAARFALGRLEEGGAPEKMPGTLLSADRWILARCAQAQAGAAQALARYDTGAARQLVDDLFWKDFCDHYLELAKDRLYGEPASEGGRSARYALARAFLMILKLYAPFIPHITEAIYQSYYRAREGAKSLHLLEWGAPGEAEPSLLEGGEAMKAAVSELRKYKSERGLPRRAALAHVRIEAPEKLIPFLRGALGDIAAACACGELSLAPGGKVRTVVEEEGGTTRG
jgi:valyl-tRNA synthetase